MITSDDAARFEINAILNEMFRSADAARVFARKPHPWLGASIDELATRGGDDLMRARDFVKALAGA